MIKGDNIIVFEEYLYMIIAYHKNSIIIFLTLKFTYCLNYELVWILVGFTTYKQKPYYSNWSVKQKNPFFYLFSNQPCS